ncbi:hypothetical protein NC651_026288 [Populus alba x Populus x berolinensis]|nr:hypothetical protein NC651_026288 [Populus alba x Populus x berolinensis]
MTVVGDTAGVERKEERRSHRSSHPCIWPVGGECTKPTPDQQIGNRNQKNRSQI